MKKLIQITIFLTLVSFYLFGQDKIELKQDTKAGVYVLSLDGTIPTPGPCANCLGIDPIVVDPVTGVMTITYSNGTKYVSPPLKGPKGDIGPIGLTGPAGPQGPQGIQGIQGPAGICPVCPPTSGGGSLPRGWIDVFAYGAKGDGSTDDTNALQAAFEAARSFDGKLIIPAPPNFYKITRTLVFGSATDNQHYIDIEMKGAPGRGIIYMGPSNSAAIKIYGMKGGAIRGLQAKVGDGVTGTAVVDIVTENLSNSTAGFSMYDCTVELNRGAGNIGVRIGKTRAGNGDISQLQFFNVMVWGGGGVSGASIAGQNGFDISDGNTCQLNWFGGGAAFCDKAFAVNQASGLYLFAFGGSQNRIDFWGNYPTTLTTIGSRWESGKQHMVWQGGGHATINVINTLISDYEGNHRLFEFAGNASVNLTNVKVEQASFGSNMIYLGAQSGNMSSLIVDGGGYQCTASQFYTNGGGWQVSARNVGKLDPASFNVKGFFPNQ